MPTYSYMQMSLCCSAGVSGQDYRVCSLSFNKLDLTVQCLEKLFIPLKRFHRLIKLSGIDSHCIPHKWSHYLIIL